MQGHADQASKRNQADLAAVIRLAAVRGAAIAVEAVGLAVGVLAQCFDATDPGGFLEDPEWHGFERIGSVLTLSPSNIEKYFTAAETVLAEAYPAAKFEPLDVTKRAVEPTG